MGSGHAEKPGHTHSSCSFIRRLVSFVTTDSSHSTTPLLDCPSRVDSPWTSGASPVAQCTQSPQKVPRARCALHVGGRSTWVREHHLCRAPTLWGSAGRHPPFRSSASRHQAVVRPLLVQPHGLHRLLLQSTVQHILHEAELVQHRALSIQEQKAAQFNNNPGDAARSLLTPPPTHDTQLNRPHKKHDDVPLDSLKSISQPPNPTNEPLHAATATRTGPCAW